MMLFSPKKKKKNSTKVTNDIEKKNNWSFLLNILFSVQKREINCFAVCNKKYKRITVFGSLYI